MVFLQTAIHFKINRIDPVNGVYKTLSNTVNVVDIK